jgi:hypothetical protein
LQTARLGAFRCNEKVGLRPLVCFAKRRYYTTVLSFLIYAGWRVKDKRHRNAGAESNALKSHPASAITSLVKNWIIPLPTGILTGGPS